MRLQRLLSLALGPLGTDLALLVITGGVGLFGAAGRRGFAVRLGLAAALGALRFLCLDGARRPGRRHVLVLGLLLLPTLYQFQFAGGRINGDGIMYYPYVRSIWKDFDLDFTNEYAHFGLLDRGDLKVLTKTGLRRSIFSIGPAVVWTPFFGLGEIVMRAQGLLGFPVDASGFGPAHRNAVALGSLLYGLAALFLIHGTLRRHFEPSTALGATLAIWGATFLHWYMVQQPTMSHALSTFAASLVVWLWDRDRDHRSEFSFFLLGLACGLAMCIRWQNGVLLLLPGLELLAAAWRRRLALGGTVVAGALLGVGALIGAFPQMAAWKALYGEWLLGYPPHGADFLRLDRPFVLETLFSSRHGLLSWTPIFWAGYLGFLPLLRRRRGVALVLLPPLALMTYVNFCSGDWWAGGSFSNRRFDSLLPIFAFGFAASIDFARRVLAAQPTLALAAVAVGAISWNVALMEQVRRGLVPRDDTVSFSALVGGSAAVVSDAVGFPTTWPASWAFAARYDRPPSQFDTLVGQYLFYRQNNLDGRIAVGDAAQKGLLGEGFARVEPFAGRNARRLAGPARIFAPLDGPEDFELSFAVAAESSGRTARVFVNGLAAGDLRGIGREWSLSSIGVARGFFRRGLNELRLEADPDVRLASVEFRRIRGQP